MPAVGKKLHHFVPRFYLRAWARKEKLFCLHEREIQFLNIRNVAAENYFYRLNEISPDDAAFIEKVLIEDSPEGLKESHRFLLHALSLPHAAKRGLEEKIELARQADAILDEETIRELRAVIEQQIVEMNENYHTHVEDLFQPILKSLRAVNLEFLQEEEQRFAFYYGLSVQYARTNHLDGARSNLKTQDFERYTRIANILIHIIAINVGHSLIASHVNNQIVLLENDTEIPFVTADQPVINLSAKPKDFNPPAKFELYYPLSPTKAMMLLEPYSTHMPHNRSISAGQAHHYNLLMAAHSFRQVYSNSEDELEAISAEINAFLSCF